MDDSQKTMSSEELTAALDRLLKARRRRSYFLLAMLPLILLCTLQMLLDLLFGP